MGRRVNTSHENVQLLKQYQAYPLEWKIDKTVYWLEDWPRGYLSFSGGLGSRVLLDVMRRYSCVQRKVMFIDTGLEHPGVRAKGLEYADFIVKPELAFPQVIKKYGYPVISKSQAFAIRKLRHYNLSTEYRNKLLHGDARGSMGKLSDKWHYLLDAPFEISEQCCDVMKKRPAEKFEEESGLLPITAEMAGESQNRKQVFVQHGCANMFGLKRPKSTPMIHWTEQDLLTYAKEHNIDYAKEYGDIECPKGGRCYTTGERRTGCMFCMFGVHLEPENDNRFTRMAKNEPKLYDYCINKLGIGEVLDYLGVNYIPYPEQITLFK